MSEVGKGEAQALSAEASYQWGGIYCSPATWVVFEVEVGDVRWSVAAGSYRSDKFADTDRLTFG